MKQLTLSLLLSSMLLFACTTPRQVFIGMSEEQFKREHGRASIVEMSNVRTVYRQDVANMKEVGLKFYYFSDGKLILMDEGMPMQIGVLPVPTPL